MILKFILKRFSLEKQATFFKSRGIVIGTRTKDGRKIYLYMVSNLFTEITYENDNPKLSVESIVLIDGLKKLNKYLEQDLRPTAQGTIFWPGP